VTGEKLSVSVITPTFNRKPTLERCIDSALALERYVKLEIIIVDDHSTDGTSEFINSTYQQKIEDGAIKLLRNDLNLGVTAAKNRGISAACNDWLIMLDSDDALLKENLQAIITEIMVMAESDILFFRCVDMASGELIGPAIGEGYSLSLESLVVDGTPGECLPVIKRESIAKYQYDDNLRGFEGLLYAAMLANGQKAWVSSVVARLYASVSDDQQLSASNNLRKRAHLMALGYSRMLKIVSGKVSIKARCVLFLKRLKYIWLAGLNNDFFTNPKK